MNRLLNNIRLRNKMLLVYFLCVFTPMIVTNLLFYDMMTDNVRDRRMKDIDRAVEQIKNDFRSQVDDAVGLSSFFYSDYTTNEILDRDYTDVADYIEAYDNYLRRVMNSYSPVTLSMQSIMIYVANPTLLHSGNIGLLSDNIKEEEWYTRGAAIARSQPVFMRTKTADGGFISFSLIRRLDYFSDRMSKEKMLKIDFKTIDLKEIFANLNMQGEMYLVNPSGQIEYTTKSGVHWDAPVLPIYTSYRSNHSIEFVKTFTNVSYLKGWKIIGTIDEGEVVKEVRKSRDLILWSGCIMIVIPTVIILIITRSINLRVVQILKHMKKVKTQNFESINEEESRDEIGQLTLEFNRMTLQIKTLIDDVYVADIQKKSLELDRRMAQLNALQSQINPHFLFNALETIRMRSVLKHESETAKIIHNMAKLFRSSLAWNKDKVTVKEELDFINCFLEIQKYRFEDKLVYEIDVEPEAYACKLPKMMFLPFVENASIHGIEPLKYGGRIQIRIVRSGEDLVFTVRDNGIGMNEEQVNKLYSYMDMNETLGDSIGIQNVIYRARMIYGDSFTFEVDSHRGQGTFIRLRIPSI
ncbi:two-component system sensor histidine kinase YesM [Paenibacillus cellulosilyticus]|uniref:Two-component system sensor histidine kinase YesM n=1 Tax=Paenibacillus cellulosilyticus TaxID=375489 RepID=A0A2V2YYL0_9BACL|nr:sensor histidine kinase [Paenibacillus cellulosilyticus]PWW07229.1 two-component system sensor histidine kinase YesM [Paenibacillus cellulosilyticus]QKS44579.1 sensor histidine kinase [Paenibacillus cellulosilyticus]